MPYLPETTVSAGPEDYRAREIPWQRSCPEAYPILTAQPRVHVLLPSGLILSITEEQADYEDTSPHYSSHLPRLR